MTAHVSDFGFAKLLSKFGNEAFLNQLSSAGIKGTIGYVTPGNESWIHSFFKAFTVKEKKEELKRKFWQLIPSIITKRMYQ